MDKKIDSTQKYYRYFFSPNKTLLQENLFLSLSIQVFTLSDFKTYVHSKEIIYQIAPIIADFLKRCVPFDSILEIFREFDREKKKKKPQFKRISKRNLIEFFLLINNTKEKCQIGFFLAKMKEWIPLSYWKYSFKNEKMHYKLDLSIIFDLVKEINQKKLLLNFGFAHKGKTRLLADFFDIKEEALNLDEGVGIQREGTIDLYLHEKYNIIDFNGFLEENDKYLSFLKKINEFSSGILFHLDVQDKKQMKKAFKKIKNLLDVKNFQEFFVIFRDQNTESSKELKKYLKEHKEFENFVFLPNLENMNKNKRNDQIQKIRAPFQLFLEKLNQNQKNPLDLKSLLKLNNDYKSLKKKLDQIKENITKRSEKNSMLTPFQNFLPFAYNKYKEFKHPEQNDQKLKKDFPLDSLLSYSFSQFSPEENSIELKFFDEKLLDFTMKYVENLNKEINSLNADYKKNPNDQLKLIIDEKIEALTNNTVNNHDLFAELFSYYNDRKSEKFSLFTSKEESFFKKFKQFMTKSLKNGFKLHIFRGIPLQIKNEFLKEIFELEEFKDENYYVISILGMQSSGKSTLLNYLFGTDFETSAGRCTRGIYSYIIKSPRKNQKILLLDTEGLASIDSSDKMFDQKIALMCFGLSDLVLINQKGELSRHLQDLLSISLYAMNYFENLRNCVPNIFFILRDQVDRTIKMQESAFELLENKMFEIAKNNKIKQVFHMKKDGFFLMPSAFNENAPSKAFGEEIVKLREKIWDSIDEKKKNQRKMIDIYINACSLWEIFNKFGQKLLVCETLREYENKLNIEGKIKVLAKKQIEFIVKEINEEMEKWNKLDQNLDNNDDFKDFIQKKFKQNFNKLDKEFEDLRKEFEGYPKLVENSIEDLNDYFKCEEGNLIYSWNFKFQNKRKELKLKCFEKDFTEKINNKLKDLMEKSTINSEKTLEEYINSNLNDFVNSLEKEYIVKKQEDELLDIIKVFNRCKRWEIDDLSLKSIEQFKKTGYLFELWVNKQDFNINLVKTNILRDVDNFYRNCSNDENIEFLNDKMVGNFFDFIENIRADKDLNDISDKINYGLITNEQCYKFVIEMQKIICRNKQKKLCDMKTEFQRKAEEKRQEFMEIFANRKDDLKLIENLCKNYMIKMIEFEMEELNKENFFRIEEKLKKIPIDPAKFMEFAYQESFTKLNPKKVYQFVTDINRFVSKIFDKHIKEILKDILNEIDGKCEKLIITKIEEFKEMLWNFVEKDKDSGKFKSEDLFNYIKKKFEKIDLKYDKLFDREIKSQEFKKYIKSINFKDNINGIPDQKQSLEKNTRDFIAGKKQIIMGCQRICPCCKSKCIKPAGVHKDHQAFHVINGFGGTKYRSTHEVVKLYCLEKENIESGWSIGTKSYPNLLSACEKLFPEWLLDFKENQNALIEEEKEKQLKCWFYVRLPLMKKYKYKDSKVDMQINDTKALPEDFV